jgi:coenzyme PQQ synthesis protein D (PqqD)
MSGFCVSSANIHSQKFDDEVVIIDTASGVYFSLRGSAVDVWSLIEANGSRASIAAALAARYDSDQAAIGAAVEHCLSQFVAHGLIRKTTSHDAAKLDSFKNGARQPFVEPLIEHFTDMQDLLLLDPVHDVSEGGWPLTEPKAAGNEEPPDGRPQ